MSDDLSGAPLPAFRFQVDFTEVDLRTGQLGADAPICRGAFAECAGLEATMEPAVIRAGGRNYGAAQRAGRVTFATVILKRGMTTTRDLWRWFALVTGGRYALRLNVVITMYAHDGSPGPAWELDRALPVKFKAADLNAVGGGMAVEELHLAHEGLRSAEPRRLAQAAGGAR